MKKLFSALLLLAALLARADSVVVFNEIMFHPATNEAALEWVELHNQMAVDVDLGGWSVRGGIDYFFPEGTVISGGGYVVVALSPASLTNGTTLTNVFGPFTGRLSNNGEKIELRNNNDRAVDSMTYGVDGDWPVAPDGAGPSLAKFDEDAASGDAAAWRASPQMGGSPGVANQPRLTGVLAPTGFSNSVTISFNEVSSVTNAQFWIELLNYGTQSLVLDNFVLARFGTTNREYLIPALTLSAGAYVVIDRSVLGFGADPGDQIVLYAAGRSNVVDAVVAKSFTRARWPEATGPWLRPGVPTPGATNQFAFHHEIVINEILFKPRPLLPTPAVYYTNTLLSITNEWRFDATGTTNDNLIWAQPAFDDSAWPIGRALFYTNIPSALPAAKNTLLNVSNSLAQNIITYYFRTPFVFTNGDLSPQFTLNPLIDDGAIFYVNGAEIYRYNLATSGVTTITRAITNIGVPVYSGPVTVPVGNLVVGTNIFAVELHRYLPSADIAFGVEVSVSGLVSPTLPERDSTESWVELFNLSTNAVSLDGWKLDGGISFDFPSNTTMAAGGYLVVARDMAVMAAKYPALPALGPFSGKLGGHDHIVLRDMDENPADEVRYFNSKPWPQYLGGFGHSLELRDPRADNSKPEAWSYSDQSSLSVWQTNVIRGLAAVDPASSPTVWNEFIMGLLGEGEVLIDDLSVLEAPLTTRRQLIQNGSFETGLTAWRTIGNHRLSQVIVDPTNPANKVLRLVATGDTEHRHNQASTTFTNNLALVNGTDYEISFRSKWISGCNRLNTRLYFNRLARTTLLTVPAPHGTPGAQNSRYAANLGPTFGGLRQSPLIPTASQAVTISAETSDPDGVTNATLFYSVNGAAWVSNAMTVTGSTAGLTISGVVPQQAVGALVQFYLRAIDGLGAAAFYPAGGTNSRALYKVAPTAQVARLHNIRLLATTADATYMHASTNVMSNEPFGVTVMYDDREVFYDTTLHLQGSERGRDNTARVGFTVSLPADHLLRGGVDSFTVDRSGGYSGKGGKQDELLIKHAVNKSGRLPGMYDDLAQVFAPRAAEDGFGMIILEKYGNNFLDSAFQSGSEGESYKLELIYFPTTTTNGDVQGPKMPQPDGVVGTDIKDLGINSEAYRWVYLKDNHVTRDDYAPMVKFAQTMSLTGTNFDAQIRNVMDVDEWLRAVAFITLMGGTDIYTYGNSHNLIMYMRPDDGKAMAFLWDMDFSFTAAATAAFPGTGSLNTTKLFANANNNRLYYNHLYDLTAVTGDSAYMSRWGAHYAGLVGQNWQPAVDYLVQRANFVRGVMPTTTPFAILNNGGNNFAVSNNTVVLSGSAPMAVHDIYVNGIRYALTWTSLTNWTLTLPLPGFTNSVAAQAFDARGTLLSNATDSIIITNLGQAALVPVVINEWMADNAGPGGFPDPNKGQFQDWFELFNPNYAAVNLTGYFLTDTLFQPTKWQVPTNTIIPARSFLLVWADNDTAQNNPTNADLHANFKLSNTGEALGLFAPDGTMQHGFAFGTQGQNVSQGLFPDGDTNGIYFMTNWTPRATNQLGAPPAPSIGSVITMSGTNSFTFSFAALANRAYRVDFKSQLEAPLWTPLVTNRVTGGPITISDHTPGQAQRFYRVVLLP